MVVGGKASSGSIAKVAGCLLLLSIGEMSKWQTVVTGGMVCPIAVKASGGGIPTTGKCTARAKAGQASSGNTIKVGSSIPEMTGCLLFLSACETSNDG